MFQLITPADFLFKIYLKAPQNDMSHDKILARATYIRVLRYVTSSPTYIYKHDTCTCGAYITRLWARISEDLGVIEVTGLNLIRYVWQSVWRRRRYASSERAPCAWRTS